MRTVSWILLLVVFSVVPSLSTLGQSNDMPFQHTPCANGVDLTGQTVSLYHILDESEQLDTFVQPLKAGFADASAYFNTHGGICGATLAQVYDDQASSSQAKYNHFAALDPKPLLMALYGSADAENLRDQLAQDEIPALGIRVGSVQALYGEDGQTPGWVFGTNPLYVEQVGSMCDYIAANPDRFPKPVIGFISWEDSWTHSADTEESRAYCQSLGVGYAGASYFSVDATYIHPHVQNLIDAGATILYTNSLETGPALVAKTLVEMGLQGKVTLATVNWAMDPTVGLLGEADLGANGLPAMNGMIGSVPLRSWAESDQPGIQLITEQADLNQRPAQFRNHYYILAWASTDLYIEVYIQTGNRVGFDHITGADIKQTLENIVYAPLGGVELIDYQGGARRTLSANRIGEMDYLGQDGKTSASATNPPLVVKDGEQSHFAPMLLPLTDYQTAPDLRPGGADVLQADAAPTIEASVTLPATSASVNDTGRIVFDARPKSSGDNQAEIYTMNADGSNLIQLTNNQFFDGQPIWSPDGTKIVFTSDRDGNSEIYVMNADGSDPINLSNNPAFEELPAWSPDGKKIAFNSDRDGNQEAYVMNANGTDQTNLSNNPAFDDFSNWSPDGTKIAFTSDRDGHNEIYVMNVDGSGVSRVTETANGDNLFPIWSPDGTKILFNSDRDGDMDIYVMNTDGSSPINLTNDQADEEKAAWSPDGKQIVFASDQSGSWDMYAMNADGSSLVNLTPDSPMTEGWASWKPAMSLSKGSMTGKIAFHSDRDGNLEIYLMNADGSDPVNLTHHPAADFLPAWSPDGKQILFGSDREGRNQIYAMDADGSRVINLSNNSSNDLFASWSPDGTRIAFISDRSGENDIYVMNADGSDPTRLTDLPGEFPVWSPDGTKIAFGSVVAGGDGEIYVINADGTGLTNLTNDPSDDGLPFWSPDGTLITFTSDQDGSEEIYVMNADGSNVVQVTQSTSPVQNHRSSWSSDGKQIVFVSTRDGNAEIYVMNADGSNPTRLTNSPSEDEVPAWQRG